MKEIKVKRDFTNLIEVLFESGEIDAFSEYEDYMKNHSITMNNVTIERNTRLMKGNIILVA